MISKEIHIRETIRRLEAWTEASGDFNSDRELGDRVLIADGWTVHQDDKFAGGFRWEHPLPNGGKICMAEQGRGNPLRDLNMAVGLFPFGLRFDLVTLHKGAPFAKRCIAKVTDEMDHTTVGSAENLAVAACIAALRYLVKPKN